MLSFASTWPIAKKSVPMSSFLSRLSIVHVLCTIAGYAYTQNLSNQEQKLTEITLQYRKQNSNDDISSHTINLPCTPITFDGHEYKVVQIGGQCWFAENLRSDQYRNGDDIPGNLPEEAWLSTTTGAQTVYAEGSSEVLGGSEDEVVNLAKYGRLYNWHAVDDARGLCPTGWHVPTDEEWTTLYDFLEENKLGMMAWPSSWSSYKASNTSSFSAMPGGDRSRYFMGEGDVAHWWSSSPLGPPFPNLSWERRFSELWGLQRSSIYQQFGLSVRCIRH